MTRLAHRFAIRIYYEDTDAGGVVYHARYLHFFERARTEFMRALGLEHTGLLEVHGVLFTVRRLELDLERPARLDDLVEVATTLRGLGGARLRVQQDAWRGDQRLARGRLELAVVGTDLRPRRLPSDLFACLTAWTDRSGSVSDA